MAKKNLFDNAKAQRPKNQLGTKGSILKDEEQPIIISSNSIAY